MEHQFGATGSLQAQYVGTRAVDQPYTTQVNGYQTVCQGASRRFPTAQPPIRVSARSPNCAREPTATTTVFN